MDNEIIVGENEQKALTVIRAGSSIDVRDQTSLTAANGLLLDVKALRHKFDEEFDPGIKRIFGVWLTGFCPPDLAGYFNWRGVVIKIY